MVAWAAAVFLNWLNSNDELAISAFAVVINENHTMVIAHLSGGLGNQLFQYAMARQVSMRLGVELRLDLFSYRSDTNRRFALEAYALPTQPACWRDVFRLFPTMAISRLAPRPIYDRYWRYLNLMGVRARCRHRIMDNWQKAGNLPLRQKGIIAERQLTFDPDVLNISDNSLIVGLWQNQNYFRDIREQLLVDFRVSTTPCQKDESLLRRMAELESVAMHVRRGDKVGRTDFKATSLGYCVHAMNEMKRRLRKPEFFIFSDDHAWLSSNLECGDNITIVSHHDELEPHEDLRLMSSCKHQIIASSSLSWWAAWLNERDDKIVLTPPASHWIQHPAHDTSQILPLNWHVLNCDED